MDECGYDFGIRERIMTIVDPTFVEHLGKREAIAYGQIPSFGLLINAPIVYFVFIDERSARCCFEIFQEWIKHSNNDGDAVEITFIEFNSDSYGVVTGPELRRLHERSMPANLRDEYEMLFIAPSRMLEIPQQSEGYRWFRKAAENQPFVVAPATPAGGPIMGLAFRKREVAFYRASEVPENHPANVFARRGVDSCLAQRKPHMPEPKEVIDRQEFQLKRFFPVTLERLRFNTHFNDIVVALQEKGFNPWQVRQAACNLTLRHRHPYLFKVSDNVNKDSSQSVLGFLLEYPETVDDAPLPDGLLTVETIEMQATADRRYLLELLSVEEVTALSNEEVTGELSRLGMLNI